MEEVWSYKNKGDHFKVNVTNLSPRPLAAPTASTEPRQAGRRLLWSLGLTSASACAGAGTVAGCATDKVRIPPSQWIITSLWSCVPKRHPGKRCLPTGYGQSDRCKDTYYLYRAQTVHLEMLKLKGNSFTPMSVSGLYSWRAFPAIKTKRWQKKRTFVKCRNSDAKSLCCSRTTTSTSGIIVRGPQSPASGTTAGGAVLAFGLQLKTESISSSLLTEHVAPGCCDKWRADVVKRGGGTLWAIALSLGQLRTQPRARCGTSQSNISTPAAPTAPRKYYGISENILVFFFFRKLFVLM